MYKKEGLFWTTPLFYVFCFSIPTDRVQSLLVPP
jgi:hypothetical protein